MAKNIAVIGAGALLSFDDPSNPGTWLDLPNALSVGDTGEQGSFVDSTPLASLVKTFIAGMSEPPEKTLTFNFVTGDANLMDLLTRAKANETLKMKIVLLNDASVEFDIVLAGWVANDPQSGEAIKCAVMGKQSGASVWTFT